ncbi:Rhamnulokinase [Acidisarcina polymorpha]|uniref:Rhamnulokinase n=1 Tax=Acidisarcina polymorpha TaxID=2211140 RepID=A0A2Z5G5F1_9BACT|nr:FGGY-family carbohydrate kinase [Acidisarcina polymorpha]AXC14422.1 Rhamnulokinase [Acidisarcina polymorpha]
MNASEQGSDKGNGGLFSRRSTPPMVAVDLGAGSCRVSLLRWVNGAPDVSVLHRFLNAPVPDGHSIRWDLDTICAGVEYGLRQCAEQSDQPIASIGVDGWAVDYVRLKDDGMPQAPPFCYRDPRNEPAELAVHQRISEPQLYALTGLQRLGFNTIYQLFADKLAGIPDALPWVNLPEYVLHRLGARRVSEYTNATHTGLIDLRTKSWSLEIFNVLGFDLSAAPELVPSGTDLGLLQGPLAALPAFKATRLIAPACHDTASAIAAIAHQGDDWAYLSSGTWSLLGTLQAQPLNSEAAYTANFTNLGAAGGGICFHKSVNGMWLIQQCLDHWTRSGSALNLSELIEAAAKLNPPEVLLEVDHPELMLPGDMPGRINKRRAEAGLAGIPEDRDHAPAFASLIFHSLAAKYAEVLRELAQVTGKHFNTLHVVGGGGRNALLNRLTAEATGLELRLGHVESSTIGNLAIQMAVFDHRERPGASLSLEQIGLCACQLEAARYE